MKNNNSLYMPMYNKGKLLLTGSLILSTLFSCTKEKQEVFGTETAVTSDAITLSKNIIFSEDFEEATPLADVGAQNSTSYGLSFVKMGGSECARFELRDTDPLASSGTRSEIKIYNAYTTAMGEFWYAIDYYIPSADYDYDNSDEIIAQFHQGNSASPSICLETYQNSFRLISRSDTKSNTKYTLAKIVKDQWTRVVMHINHSNGNDGFIQVWLNGEKTLDVKGPNAYPLSGGYDAPKLKVGIYKWDWNGSGTTDTKKRVLYIDNIKLGNASSSYEEITGGSTTSIPVEPTPAPAPDPTPEPTTPTTPEPTPTPTPEPTLPATSKASISSMVLVDANTEKDLLTLKDGGTYSLKDLATIKLNVRANASSSTAAVNFVMSGAVKANNTDKAFPYALMGDDGKGNYYYGTWKYPPTGVYKITATPYEDEKGDVTGSPVTITFTLTK